MAKDNNELAAKISATAGNGQVTVANQVATYLEKMKSQIALALPKHLSADRMARLALTEIRTNPRLLQCSIESLMAGVMKAAQDGLEFGTGQCYLVPYGQQAQYLRGYQGLIHLVRRSGELVSIAADVVHSADVFEYEKGYDEKLRHVPHFSQNRGELVLVYAYALLRDGGRAASVMSISEVEEIRSRSKAKDHGPWVTDYKEMAKKTVLRRLCKLLPMSLEVQRAVEEEDRDFVDVGIDLGEVKTEEEKENGN